MRLLYSLLFFIITFPVLGQVVPDDVVVPTDSLPPVIDSLYREDQIYTAIAYNLLQGKPAGFSQNSFSTNLTLGVLRDMPVNKARTYSVAAGLGYSYNNIQYNLKVSEGPTGNTYEVVPENSFDKNKLVLHYLELPVELRWRNSDAVSHKFWRVYLGFKVSWLFADKAQYEGAPADIKIKGNNDLNRFVYGTYLSVGWNTWNLYAYYGLNPIFKSAFLPSGEKVKLNSVNLGLMFYIL
jgi:hypothetical protein